ncbi:MAG TPA: molybdate ABC transporter substrate-binding protein [Devosiaceae bacterium]|jgi:molybdate transport system substrate-binding protein|nr:molybdate ABC transporter substrate-binding protein [Devosiaceae bacterium]
MRQLLVSVFGLLLAWTGVARAESVLVAAAANVTVVAEEIAAAFTAETDHDVVLAFGSTGGLYAQIAQGAPFEVYLAADAERPALALAAGFAVAGSDFTYADGRLALYSTTRDVSTGAAALMGDFQRLAIADPELAPYGRAAVEVLAALELTDTLADRLVVGTSVTQALQFVVSGNAELGLVAAGQVGGSGTHWVVPAEFHSPIRQDAVLLQAGATNPAALAFMAFLRGEAAATILRSAGYLVDAER